MLHIVQVILAGSAEVPQVFADVEAAQAAYVECAKRYWAQSYAAYCQRGGVDSNRFESARAFVDSFDLADRSRIHLWSITAVGANVCQPPGPDLAALKDKLEQVAQLVQTLDQASGSVRERVSGLLATLTAPAGSGSAEPATPTERDLPRILPAGDLAPQPEAPPQPPPAGAYDTKEWKDYVEMIKNMCGGNRSEYHLFTRHDWRQAVYHDGTSLEYWDWVGTTLDYYIERAQQAGYSVVPDQCQPGYYRFVTPSGEVSERVAEAEGEAWCRAGLHLEGK